jgi:hypothetical protein
MTLHMPRFAWAWLDLLPTPLNPCCLNATGPNEKKFLRRFFLKRMLSWPVALKQHRPNEQSVLERDYLKSNRIAVRLSAKNFVDAGPWALALTTAMAQHRQEFLCRFFQKAAAFLTTKSRSLIDRK